MDRRRRDQPDAYLDWKVRIFVSGAVLLMAAVLTGQDVLALLAVAVLSVGVVLMLLVRLQERRRAAQSGWEAEEDEEEDGQARDGR